MLVAGIYAAPLISVLLVSFEQAWYGQGWGKIGAAAAVLMVILSFLAGLYGSLYCRGVSRLLAVFAVCVYLYLLVVQMV